MTEPILYWTGREAVFTQGQHSNASPQDWITSMLSGENHVTWGIIIGTAIYLCLYFTKNYDYAMFVFGILMGGIAVDTYVNGFYH